MKKIIISVILIFSLFSTSCGQLKVFKGAEKIPGVETVYIGGAMLRLGLNAAGNEYAEIGKDFNADISSIEAMEIISADSKAAVAKLMPLVDRVINDGNYEIGTQATEENETSTTYFSPVNSRQKANMLIVSQEKTELSVVLIQGIKFNSQK